MDNDHAPNIWQDLNDAYERKVKPNVEQVEDNIKQKIDEV